MPLFWMAYKTAMNAPIGVLIVEATDLLQARFRAAVFELDRGAEFAEGFALDADTAKLIPERLIGRMIPVATAADLLKEIESAEPTPNGLRPGPSENERLPDEGFAVLDRLRPMSMVSGLRKPGGPCATTTLAAAPPSRGAWRRSPTDHTEEP